MFTAVINGCRRDAENRTPKWVYRSSPGCAGVSSLGRARSVTTASASPGQGVSKPAPRNAGS
jgi:hypothetical protein